MPLSPFDCNFLDANRSFVAFSERGRYLERAEVAIVSCGLPVPELCFGFLKPPYDRIEAAAEVVRSFFDETKLPCKLMMGEGEPTQLRSLEALGWERKRPPTPVMVLRAARARRPATALEIREVRTDEDLVSFRETAFAGFGYPVRAAHLFLHAGLHALPYLRMFLGRLDWEPVATSMLVMSAGIAGIYWVGTVEAHRGRGYGEALTWAAVDAGAASGCGVACLQASALGQPVYARMGFEHVADYENLLPPVPAG